MNEHWKTFLHDQETGISDSQSENYLSGLSQFELIEISGDDAETFLQGQLSSDLSKLESGAWQISSWCNIKGRVISTFLLYRDEQRYFLLLENNISETLSKRMQMFILRARVSITNSSEELVSIGLTGPVNTETHSFLDRFENTHVLALTRDNGPLRSIIFCPVEKAIELWQRLATQAAVSQPGHWETLDIQAGIPWVGEQGSEEFLPQSLNLDLLGGLSFDKGCYPGQEIVARMHFRGKLKQRMYSAICPTKDSIPVKAKVYSSSTKQHVGQIVNSVETSEGNYHVLLTLDLEAAEADTLYLDSDNKAQLALTSLPYKVVT